MEDHLSWPRFTELLPLLAVHVLDDTAPPICGSGCDLLSSVLKMQKPPSETFKCFRIFWKVPNFHTFMMFLMSLRLILIGCSIPLVGFLPKKGKAIRRTFPILALGPSQEHKPLNLICSSPSKSFTTLDPKQYSAIFRLQNITSGYLGHHHCQAAKKTFSNFTYQVSLAFWILSIRILRSGLEFELLGENHGVDVWIFWFTFLIPQEKYMGLFGILGKPQVKECKRRRCTNTVCQTKTNLCICMLHCLNAVPHVSRCPAFLQNSGAICASVFTFLIWGLQIATQSAGPWVYPCQILPKSGQRF